MNETAQMEQGVVIDEFVRSRRRTISIELKNDGRVVVRAPLKAPYAEVMDFVRRKETWIIRHRIAQIARSQAVPRRCFGSGETLLFLGETYELRIVEGEGEYLTFDNGFLLSAAFPYDRRELFIQWYKSKARDILKDRVAHFSDACGLRCARIIISDAVTKWGSCAPDGRITFSWRLAMAPLTIIDYVVVHELAHIAELNHSSRFWRRVSSLMPDYQNRRKWLRENGHLLSL